MKTRKENRCCDDMEKHIGYKPQPTHTPTPWNWDSSKTIRLGTPLKYEVASLGLSREVAEANAAFIVRAVNAHEELVSFIRSLDFGNECGCPFTKSVMHDDDCHQIALEKRRDEAIAKAEQR